MIFTVIDVIDCKTIKVNPRWRWLDTFGDIVTIRELESLQKQNELILNRLKLLLLSQNVELANPLQSSHGTLMCSVILNDVELSYYFPELK